MNNGDFVFEPFTQGVTVGYVGLNRLSLPLVKRQLMHIHIMRFFAR